MGISYLGHAADDPTTPSELRERSFFLIFRMEIDPENVYIVSYLEYTFSGSISLPKIIKMTVLEAQMELWDHPQHVPSRKYT